MGVKKEKIIEWSMILGMIIALILIIIGWFTINGPLLT